MKWAYSAQYTDKKTNENFSVNKTDMDKSELDKKLTDLFTRAESDELTLILVQVAPVGSSALKS